MMDVRFDQIKRVPLGTIDLDDHRFRISLGEATDTLRDSIGRFGILAPPICYEVDDGYVCAAGFKRVSAARELLGLDHHIAVRALDHHTPLLTVLAMAVEDARRDGEIGPFTVMRALRRAIDLEIDSDAIVAQLLPNLAQKAHSLVFGRHLKLERIPSPLATVLEDRGVSLRRALNFISLTVESANLLAQLATRFRLSGRAIEEWSRMIGDIARREEQSWSEVIEHTALFELAAQEDRQLDQRVREARANLWRLRYPTWHSAREAAKALAGSVDLPERVKLGWDESFEQDGLVVEIQVRDGQELRQDLTSLLDPDRLKGIQRLLESL